jgi:hypothetical protein
VVARVRGHDPRRYFADLERICGVFEGLHHVAWAEVAAAGEARNKFAVMPDLRKARQPRNLGKHPFANSRVALDHDAGQIWYRHTYPRSPPSMKDPQSDRV